MKFTERTRRFLASRREDRSMKAAGYNKRETDWEIHRGMKRHMVIVDAKISACGKYVWTKLGEKPIETMARDALTKEG